MHVNLIHNDNIKTFDDVVQVEEDRLHAEKPVNEAFISATKMRGAYDSKYKKDKGEGLKYSKRGIEANSSGHKHKHEKHSGKKDKNMNCFNCDKADHFAHDCCRTCAAISSTLRCIYLTNMGRQEILVFYQWKTGMRVVT
jgi:hypothetical protein